MDEDADLIDDVREVMAMTFGVDESELPDDVSQETFSRWTSLYHMTLLLALEERFDTTFTMEEMPAMTSLSKVVATLKRRDASVTR